MKCSFKVLIFYHVIHVGLVISGEFTSEFLKFMVIGVKDFCDFVRVCSGSCMCLHLLVF